MLRISGLEAGPGLAGKAPRLEIYDLRGRLVLSLSLEPFRSGDGFAIPMEFLKRLGQSRLILVLRGAGRMRPYPLNFGGLR